MKLDTWELKKIEIPFRVSFKHSSAERNLTETVIAIARGTDGVTGYGEGCPRVYVTGETIESCMRFAKKHNDSILKINSITSLKKFLTENEAVIDENPAAWSAIEIALLDLLGKSQEKSVEEILRLPKAHGAFQYTAVLGAAKPEIFQAQLAQYLQLGFRDFKIKVSGERGADASNIAAIRAALPTSNIRLDANNLWSDAAEAIAYLATLPSHFWAIEEPLRARDYAGLKMLANTLPCKIILDESFLRAEDFAGLSEISETGVPNIRISKMGGLLRSLSIAEECRARGIKFIIGAQVGETSILTRVAMTLANAYRDMLIVQEGAYGTYLLKKDIVDLPIMFGENGLAHLNARADINGFGLAVAL